MSKFLNSKRKFPAIIECFEIIIFTPIEQSEWVQSLFCSSEAQYMTSKGVFAVGINVVIFICGLTGCFFIQTD